jgi:hypothetical protein
MEKKPEPIEQCLPEEKLTFKAQKMVGWYDPAQLANTGIKASISSVFGSYADNRELQAAITHQGGHDYTTQFPEEIWFDYTADLGDGFNSTYTIAKLLARDTISLKSQGATIETKRGNILIMGGDQVYPVASRKNYNDKLVGPYHTAYPYEEGDGPHIYAIPGNHDWYDGLSYFLKIFCQQRALGNWRSQQHRSYFAIRIAKNLWVWGIDIQLDTDIDKPQLDYFNKIASKMTIGDKVILCTAQPSWVYTTKPKDPSYHNLNYFEQEHIVKKGFTVVVSLAGDLHHYSRYAPKNENVEIHKITSGGGGAFLHPTHNLPESICVREGVFDFKQSYPGKTKSRLLILWNLIFPITNWKFGFFMGGFYLLFAWILQSTTRNNEKTFLENLSGIYPSAENVDGVLAQLKKTIIFSPFLVVLIATIVFGLFAFADKNSGKGILARIFGVLHGISHLVFNFLMLWIFCYVNSHILGLSLKGLKGVGMLSLEMFLIGGGVGSMIMGFYLIICNLVLGTHDNEAFSSLAWQDNKNFLRFHITPEQITIYPIGVKSVTRWKKNGDTYEGKETPVELIEDPIKIKLKESPAELIKDPIKIKLNY